MRKISAIHPIFYCFSLIILNDDLKCITLHLIYCVCAQKVTEKIMSWSSISHTLLYCYTTNTRLCYIK